MIKSSPKQDHRRGHRLALPERAQARAEGVSGRGPEGWRTSDADDAEPTRLRRQRSSAAGAAGLLGGTAGALADEGPPETTTVRLPEIAGHLHRAGLRRRGAAARRGLHRRPLCARGSRRQHAADGRARRDRLHRELRRRRSSPLIDAGEPITVLAGVHPGCFELFAARAHPQHHGPEGQERRRRRASARASTCSWPSWRPMSGSIPPRTSTGSRAPSPTPIELFADGKIDAFLGFPPEPQELRARKIGHVIVNSAVDRPWSQYFCCMLAGNTEFVRNYPVATKRVAARHPQGRRPLRHRAGRASRSAGRWRVHRAATTTRCRR